MLIYFIGKTYDDDTYIEELPSDNDGEGTYLHARGGGERYVYSSNRKNKSRGASASQRPMHGMPSLFVQLPRTSHKPSYSTRSPRVARYADNVDDNSPAEIVYQDLSQIAAISNSSVAMEHSMVMFNKSTQKLKELVSDLDKSHDENLRKLENSLNQCIISVAVSQATDKVDLENKINEIRTAMVYAENFQKNILLTKAIDLDERMADIEDVLNEYKSVMSLSAGDQSNSVEVARRFNEIDGVLDSVLEREGELQQQLLSQERQTAQLMVERDELRSLVNLYGSEIENLKQRLSSTESSVQDMVDQARRDLAEAQRVAHEQTLKQEAFQSAMSTLGQRFVYQPEPVPQSSPAPQISNRSVVLESSVDGPRPGLSQSSVHTVYLEAHSPPALAAGQSEHSIQGSAVPAPAASIENNEDRSRTLVHVRSTPSQLVADNSRDVDPRADAAQDNNRGRVVSSVSQPAVQPSAPQASVEERPPAASAQNEKSSKRAAGSKPQPAAAAAAPAEPKVDPAVASKPSSRPSSAAAPVQPTTPRSKQGQRPNSRSQSNGTGGSTSKPVQQQAPARAPVVADQEGSVWVDDASEVLESAGRHVRMNVPVSNSLDRSSQPQQLVSASALQTKIEEHEALVQRLDNVRTKIKNEVAAWISKFQEANKRKPTDADKGDVLPLYKAYHEVRFFSLCSI